MIDNTDSLITSTDYVSCLERRALARYEHPCTAQLIHITLLAFASCAWASNDLRQGYKIAVVLATAIVRFLTFPRLILQYTDNTEDQKLIIRQANNKIGTAMIRDIALDAFIAAGCVIGMLAISRADIGAFQTKLIITVIVDLCLVPLSFMSNDYTRKDEVNDRGNNGQRLLG